MAQILCKSSGGIVCMVVVVVVSMVVVVVVLVALDNTYNQEIPLMISQAQWLVIAMVRI